MSGTALVEAAKDGQVDIVRDCLTRSIPARIKINALELACIPRTSNHRNVALWSLPIARQNAHLEIVRLLLEKNANLGTLQNRWLNITPTVPGTSFMYQVILYSTPNIVRELIEAGLYIDSAFAPRALVDYRYLGHERWTPARNAMRNALNLPVNSGRSFEQAGSNSSVPNPARGQHVRKYARSGNVTTGSRVVTGNFTNAATGMRASNTANTANSKMKEALYDPTDPTKSLFAFSSLQKLVDHPLTRLPMPRILKAKRKRNNSK